MESDDEMELRYWMNSDTGRVISSEDCPGKLWIEIDFDDYYRLTHHWFEERTNTDGGEKEQS